MDEVRDLLNSIMNEGLKQLVLSNSRNPDRGSKVSVRPVAVGGRILFQETLYRGSQVFHGNYDGAEMADRAAEGLQTLFRQGQIRGVLGTPVAGFAAGTEVDVTCLVSKKGKLGLKVRKSRKETADADAAAGKADVGGSRCDGAELSHNRRKRYIIEEGKPADFLVGLGVQTPEGRVVRARYDKFRQINRYLEFIQDVLEELPQDRTLRIIDFGCGKSYLTFAMYYYLHILEGRDVRITGLDLKEDVIRDCNALAGKLGYEGLTFERGDISEYEGATEADMVVTLHACDLATDYALDKAVRWGARVILAVPCCQHELNRQIACEELQGILKYGLLRERIAALVTDGLRANLLERQGYRVQVLEFIDMEHTPKNILIRAVKKPGMQPGKGDITSVKELLGVSPTLEKLLEK